MQHFIARACKKEASPGQVCCYFIEVVHLGSPWLFALG